MLNDNKVKSKACSIYSCGRWSLATFWLCSCKFRWIRSSTAPYNSLLHPIQATPYTLFQAIFGNGYPVALLDEEKILPVGKEITAVGFCRTRDGALEVKPCQELPFSCKNLFSYLLKPKGWTVYDDKEEENVVCQK
uniref:RING-type E3 ubiquitin transferase n=1 Tax=Ananas comosus var. bracteatus TaxID=296719 RepID=A0A6V7QQE0_ANACO|nr:unnamed protein product [Ananas comosus var. bracteatus]